MVCPDFFETDVSCKILLVYVFIITLYCFLLKCTVWIVNVDLRNIYTVFGKPTPFLYLQMGKYRPRR